MRLHYAPRTRARRPRWMLKELGVPCDLVRLDPSKAETRTAPLQDLPAVACLARLGDGPAWKRATAD